MKIIGAALTRAGIRRPETETPHESTGMRPKARQARNGGKTMLLLLFQFMLVVSVAYGVPALLLWLAFDLTLLQIVVFSGIAGTLLIVALSALDAPAFMSPGTRKKRQKRTEN